MGAWFSAAVFVLLRENPRHVSSSQLQKTWKRNLKLREGSGKWKKLPNCFAYDLLCLHIPRAFGENWLRDVVGGGEGWFASRLLSPALIDSKGFTYLLTYKVLHTPVFASVSTGISSTPTLTLIKASPLLLLSLLRFGLPAFSTATHAQSCLPV